MKKWKMPALLGLVAVTLFMGCRAEVDVRRGQHYGNRIWQGDPYCRNSWDYGCSYSGNDGYRVRIIHNRRWGGWPAIAAAKPTSWAQEFNLNSRAVATIKDAFTSALAGDSSKLEAIGISQRDVMAMERFQMPADESVAAVSHMLQLNQQDAKDFLEIFLIRMKTSFANNEK